MNGEEDILKTIIEKESWEEIIYYIVSLENLNPWDVDLVKLTERFIKFVQSVQDLDFKIPAKVVFVSVILLKLKADYLSIFEEKEEEKIPEQKPPIDLGIDPNLVQLGYPMKRVPKRQVTLDELITALQKALQVREKKVERQFKIRTQIQRQFSEEDISVRIENIFKEIKEALKKSETEKIKFKDLVDVWKREKIIEHFVPILHLQQDRKIDCDQEDFFKEIFIKKGIED